MEQIKAHIAVSLDGHTATPDYELDWMPREVKELVAREHAAASCLLMGGGKLLTSLIKAGLLDSLTIYTVPVMAGKGIGFVGETSGSLWKLSESRVLDNGVVCSTYLFGGNI